MKRRTFCQSALATAFTASMPVGQIFAGAHAASKVVSDINAVTLDGGTTVIEKAVLEELSASLTGQLLLPTSEGYDSARQIWNGMIDRRPAVIVRCQNANDIKNAVDVARDYGVLTSVRGGGHSLAGKSVCEGGIMIDCALMDEVTLDVDGRTATAGPGTLLGGVDRASQAYGLATPAGVVSHTGAAGLTLGGGFGKLSRRYGLTSDNTRRIDVVTAAGELKTCTADENPDLFWAVRGGGGNFGVATKFVYELHEVGTDFMQGSIMHPHSAAKDVLNFYGEFQETAPKDLSCSVTTVLMPNGKGFVNISVFWNGDPTEGEKVIAPLRTFGKPMREVIDVKKYVDIQSSTDRNVPPGGQYYQKAGFMTAVDPKLVDAMVDQIADPNPFSTTMNLTHVGGAINERAPDATAYPNRDAAVQLVYGGSWPERSDEQADRIEMLRSRFKTFEPYLQGFYINTMVDESEQRIRANWRGNYDRLVGLKNEYDPTNLFRLNANIVPAA